MKHTQIKQGGANIGGPEGPINENVQKLIDYLLSVDKFLEQSGATQEETAQFLQ